MAKIAYVATVQLLIEAPDHSSACDAISELLHDDDCVVLDWGYLQIGGQRLGPHETLIGDEYQEGDFLGERVSKE